MILLIYSCSLKSPLTRVLTRCVGGASCLVSWISPHLRQHFTLQALIFQLFIFIFQLTICQIVLLKNGNCQIVLLKNCDCQIVLRKTATGKSFCWKLQLSNHSAKNCNCQIVLRKTATVKSCCEKLQLSNRAAEKLQLSNRSAENPKLTKITLLNCL